MCNFCDEHINKVDYKNREFLRRFVTSQFKIATSRRNGICNKHQRMIANAIKNARYMSLMPYTRLQIAKRRLSSSPQ